MKISPIAALEARPAVWLATGLIIGITANLNLWYGLAILPILMVAGSWKSVAISILGLAVGLVLARPSDLNFQTLYFSGTVVVKSTERQGAFTNYAIADAGGRKVQLVLPKEARVTYGTVIEMQGRLRPLEPADAKKRGYAAQLRPIGEFTIVDPGSSLFLASNSLRDRILRNLRQAVPEPEWRLAAGITLGASHELYPSQLESLRDSGTAHIVATSGLHVIIVAGICFLLLELLPIPRHTKIAILGAILAIYALSAGLRPSIVRAGLMAMFLSGAYLFNRVPDSLSGLSWAAIVILIWNPHQLFNAGFQLSFMAVLALILHMPAVSDRTEAWGYWKWPVRTAAVSLIVWLAVTPLLGIHFGRVSLVGPIANIPAVAVLPVTVSTSLLAGFWPLNAPGSALCGQLAGWSCGAILTISQWANSLSWSSLAWQPQGLAIPALYYMAFFGLWNPKRRPIPESKRSQTKFDASPAPGAFP